ncbi:hypothetical protein C5B95_07355 [Rathayibacter sp. AY1A7]|nr:hypothetical protein C5B95_07355 [Rathayibacter sp. AY1A7]
MIGIVAAGASTLGLIAMMVRFAIVGVTDLAECGPLIGVGTGYGVSYAFMRLSHLSLTEKMTETLSFGKAGASLEAVAEVRAPQPTSMPSLSEVQGLVSAKTGPIKISVDAS